MLSAWGPDIYDRTSGTHNLLDAHKLLVARDGNRLDEEFISALEIQRRILLHRLEQYWEGWEASQPAF